MRRVHPRLWLASFVRISNIWLLDDGERRFVIDTGHWSERGTLLLSLWRAGVRRPGDLAAVLLTHRHSDHAGNAAWLRERFRCPVICHDRDAAVLSGKSAPARMGGRGARHVHELLCRIEDRFPARCEVDETYGQGAWRWGFEVVHVPGHTDGSVMLWHGPTRSLFSGDAIIAGPPLRWFEKFRLAVPDYSADAAACHAHVRSFLERLPPTDALCSGHGPAVVERAHEKLRSLLVVSEPRERP
jgi:glyoxylase-like metal-dependent hydrolase (beta-lactamase superfamily II)